MEEIGKMEFGVSRLVEGNRPSVLVSRHENVDTYSYMDEEWIPIGMSAKICIGGSYFEYEYNKQGDVRHIDKFGGRRPIKKNLNMFEFSAKKSSKGVIHRVQIYMPKKGEICVGNGEKSFRFDSISEACKALKTSLKMGKTVKGWKMERGWPQPNVVGDCKRKTMYDDYRAEWKDGKWRLFYDPYNPLKK